MEQGKKLILGIDIYLIVKGVLNLILGGFALGNIFSLLLQIAFAVVLLARIKYVNYVIAAIFVVVALWHMPANFGNLPGNWIYLLEGILDICAAALLVFVKEIKEFYDPGN